MTHKRLSEMLAIAGFLAVGACGPTDEEAAPVFAGFYGPEMGVVLSQKTHEQLEQIGVADAELQVVVNGDILPLYDERLPEMTSGDTYVFLADGAELGRLEIIGSAGVPDDQASEKFACFQWLSVGCCSAGARQRRLCCYSYPYDCYYQYRCATGPC